MYIPPTMLFIQPTNQKIISGIKYHRTLFLALSHPMPWGGGEALTKFELHSPRSPIAASRSDPVRPVSSSMIDFSVTYGRPTRLLASGVQRSNRPAGSLWRVTWPARDSRRRFTTSEIHGSEPYRYLFVGCLLQEMLGVIQIIRNAKKGIFQLPTYHM